MGILSETKTQITPMRAYFFEGGQTYRESGHNSLVAFHIIGVVNFKNASGVCIQKAFHLYYA